MIVLILKDGLGNQLFQYAAARALAVSLNTKLQLDISSYKKNELREYSLGHFLIEENFVSSFQFFLFRIKIKLASLFDKTGRLINDIKVSPKGHHYSPLIGRVKDNTWIEGYWQSEKYFESIQDIIRKEFVVKEEPNPYCLSILKMIRETNSVSLHVRRGDYVSDSNVNSLHGVCSLEYYRQAIQLIMEKVIEPCFFIFSDDMEWVKRNINMEGKKVIYVDGEEKRDYDDLRLMYSCGHSIIANSSFSWWGAWLNANPCKIVIAPKKWVQSGYFNPDLIPEQWFQIDV